MRGNCGGRDEDAARVTDAIENCVGRIGAHPPEDQSGLHVTKIIRVTRLLGPKILVAKSSANSAVNLDALP
jgi:hypothetical protein